MLLDSVICIPPRDRPIPAVVCPAAVVVEWTVEPTALVAPPATPLTADVVVFTTPPAALVAPPSKPPSPPERCVVAVERLEAIVLVSLANISS